eukprot:735639-Pyramimonas_sp.AAC.1
MRSATLALNPLIQAHVKSLSCESATSPIYHGDEAKGGALRHWGGLKLGFSAEPRARRPQLRIAIRARAGVMYVPITLSLNMPGFTVHRRTVRVHGGIRGSYSVQHHSTTIWFLLTHPRSIT